MLIAVVLTACGKDGADSSGRGSGDGGKEFGDKGSFDPAINALRHPVGALDPKGSKGGRPLPEIGTDAIPSPVVSGRESAVAAEILAMAPGDARSLAMIQLFSQWAKSDLETAMAYGEAIAGDLAMKRAFHQGVAPQLVKEDPEKLLEIIEAKNWWPDQWLTEREALRKVAGTDFERAKEFFAETGKNKQHGEEAYRYTRQIAEETSTEAAFAYVERIQSDRGKGGAVRAAVGHWAAEDSIAASQYVSEASEPNIRDHAILGLVDEIWQTNPDDSLTWLKTIDDPDLKQASLVRIARAWSRVGEQESIEGLLQADGVSSTDRQAVTDALAEDAAE